MDPFDSEYVVDSIQYDTPDEDDRGILCDSRQSLGLEYNYVPDWRPPHAIREYHQNWKDGIKEASGLKGRDFKILDRGFDSKGVYIIEARHPNTDKLLGFISWNNGTLQYSNFGAQLSQKALNLGVSTKRNDDNLAGTHGEGFKVASLVMLRRGYRVRYEASKYYWSFQFGGRNRDILYCKLTRIQEKKLKKQMEDFEAKAKTGSPRELEANIWEDVTVKIGRILGKGDKVGRADFLKWIKVSLDLDRPSKIISARHGSLILDDEFKGRIYLKGLLLENEPATPFKFCYNFYQGEVNRDRQRLSNEREEARILAKIWGEAIQLDEAATLTEFVELLQANRRWADVNLAEEYISIETAKKIWQQFQVENPENRLFYYFDQNGDKDIELITKSLQKEPAPLKKAVWLSLRRFKLIRTPQEHRQHLLQNAIETDFHKTPYAEEVERALRSVLALDSRTRDLRLDFRSGTSAELDILLQGSNLVINDKWLDFHASHDKSFCSLFLEATAEQITIDRFSCGHIIKNLYDLILVELSKGSSTQENRSSDTAEHLRQMVREKIDQMPCMVEVIQADSAGVLEVSWVHAESEKISKLHHLELKGRVTMHRESTCADKKSELLASSPSERRLSSLGVDGSIEVSNQTGGCGCPEKVVSLKDSRAVFDGLDHQEKYFPMVARTDSQAFFAPPPNAVCPKAPDMDLPDRLPSTPIFTFTAQSECYEDGVCNSQNGGFANVYDDSDEGESIWYNDFPKEGSMSNSGSDITRFGEAICSRSGSCVSSPNTLIQEDLVSQPSKNRIELQCKQLYARHREIQKLKTETAMLRESLCVKDQQLQSFETEIVTLRSQLDVQVQQYIQLEHKLENQRELLAVKESGLGEAKLKPIAQTKALDANSAARSVSEQQLKRVMAGESQLRERAFAADGPGGGQNTDTQVESVRNKTQQLMPEQAKDIAKRVLEVALSATFDAQGALPKRRRTKEDGHENEDALRPLESAMKRARHENITNGHIEGESRPRTIQ